MCVYNIYIINRLDHVRRRWRRIRIVFDRGDADHNNITAVIVITKNTRYLTIKRS